MTMASFCITMGLLLCVFVVGIPIAVFLNDFIKIYREHRQNKRWRKHCSSCLYYNRIQFTTLDTYHKRGVVCDDGAGFEYVTDPLSCTRYKEKKSPSK